MDALALRIHRLKVQGVTQNEIAKGAKMTPAGLSQFLYRKRNVGDAEVMRRVLESVSRLESAKNDENNQR